MAWSAGRTVCAPGAMVIFHLTEPRLWQDALAIGSYTWSTRGASLDEVGFIHCSFPHQVEAVANRVYADWDEPLVLLELDPEQIPAEIRVENLEGGTEGFPHIYGPLPTAAVTAVHSLHRESGGWKLPTGL